MVRIDIGGWCDWFQKKIESGKKVGYSEFLLIDDTEYVREFVLWKEKN